MTFLCAAALAIDGDTLRCRGVGDVRLARIDAPELSDHCRDGRKDSGRPCAPGDPLAAQAALHRLTRTPVTCEQVDANPWWRGFQERDRYGRIVARCSAGGRDLGEAQLAGGFAVRWP